MLLSVRSGAVRLAETPGIGTPIYKAGLDAGDELKTIDGTRVVSAEDAFAVLKRHRPGDTVNIVYVDRSGGERRGEIALVENPSVELVTIESSGGTLTPEQRAFRDGWLK